MIKKLTVLIIALVGISLATQAQSYEEFYEKLSAKCEACSQYEVGSEKYIELGCREIATICPSLGTERGDDGSIIIDTGDTTQRAASRDATAIVLQGQKIKILFMYANRKKELYQVTPLVEVLTDSGKLLWSNKSQSKYTHNYVFTDLSLQSMTSSPSLKTLKANEDALFIVPATLNTEYTGKAIVRTTIKTMGKDRRLQKIDIQEGFIYIKRAKGSKKSRK